MTRSPSLLALLLTLLAGLTLGAGSAHAARGLEIAVQDDHALVWNKYIGQERALHSASRLRASWIRANVQWGWTLHGQAKKKRKPVKLVYDFAAYDRLVAAAAARGMQVQLSLTGPPPRWAAAGRARGWVGSYKPNAKEFGRFARAIATHFRGRVTRWSIWNEPNWRSTLSPGRTAARQYRTLYLKAYAAIKAVDRNNKVLFGELSPQAKRGWAYAPLQFARDALCVDSRWRKRRGCATVKTDGFAQHAYEFSHAPGWRGVGPDEVTIGTLDHLNNALRKLRRARALSTPAGRTPPIYITEFGYRASGPLSLPAAKRAKYVRQAFTIALGAPNVRQMLQYKLVRTPGIVGDYGIVDQKSGRPDAAFRSLARWVSTQVTRSAIGVPVILPPPGVAR
jgi:hypothetical protein